MYWGSGLQSVDDRLLQMLIYSVDLKGLAGP